MSNFDVIIGLKAQTLDPGLKSVFDNPSAKAKLFVNTIEKDLGELLGKATFQYEVKSPPTFTLSPPSDDKWNNAIKGANAQPSKPSEGVFQFILPDTLFTMTAMGTPVSTEGPIEVYCQVSEAAGSTTLQALAVLFPNIDMSKDSNDKSFAELAVPEILRIVNTMIKGYTLPGIPSFEGVSFNPIAFKIQNETLLIGATISTNPKKQVDFSGYTWPGDPLFTLLSPALMNAVIATELKPFQGKTGSEKTEKGDDLAFKATADYSYTIKSLTATLNPANATHVNANIQLELKAHAGISGAAAAMLCPVGTALNAL